VFFLFSGPFFFLFLLLSPLPRFAFFRCFCFFLFFFLFVFLLGIFLGFVFFFFLCVVLFVFVFFPRNHDQKLARNPDGVGNLNIGFPPPRNFGTCPNLKPFINPRLAPNLIKSCHLFQTPKSPIFLFFFAPPPAPLGEGITTWVSPPRGAPGNQSLFRTLPVFSFCFPWCYKYPPLAAPSCPVVGGVSGETRSRVSWGRTKITVNFLFIPTGGFYIFPAQYSKRVKKKTPKNPTVLTEKSACGPPGPGGSPPRYVAQIRPPQFDFFEAAPPLSPPPAPPPIPKRRTRWAPPKKSRGRKKKKVFFWRMARFTCALDRNEKTGAHKPFFGFPAPPGGFFF